MCLFWRFSIVTIGPLKVSWARKEYTFRKSINLPNLFLGKSTMSTFRIRETQIERFRTRFTFQIPSWFIPHQSSGHPPGSKRDVALTYPLLANHSNFLTKLTFQNVLAVSRRIFIHLSLLSSWLEKQKKKEKELQLQGGTFVLVILLKPHTSIWGHPSI